MERGEPDWQTASPDTGAKMLYHLGRSTHLSGRCVECGACENACASGVNIRYLIKDVTRFIDDTYDYQAGMDIDTEPAMLTYKTDDPEIGFLGYEGSDADV
jgi:ferredoxin